jgi:hypothetical protein
MNWTPNLSWILPDLALGGSFPCQYTSVLVEHYGLRAIIDVRSEYCDDADIMRSCGVRFLHLPTPDMARVSQEMLDSGVSFAASAADEGRKLLVHCEHGIGRSALVELCILTYRGFSPVAALSLAKDRRALLSPSEDQYDAWVCWISRHGISPAPTFHDFGVIAYRHLATGR